MDEVLNNLTPGFAGYEGYNGFGDPSIQFIGNASNFSDEGKSGLTYTMVITNQGASAVDRKLAICPGYFTDAADIKDASGTAVDAIIAQGTIIGAGGTICTGAGTPKSITEFLAFIKYNPVRFTGLKMLVDNSAQFDNSIYVKQNSPFRNLQDREITPNVYKDSTQTDDKRVEIPLEQYQMDNNTTVITTISASRKVTLNWFVGAIKNPAYELAVKAAIARNNSERFYGQR